MTARTPGRPGAARAPATAAPSPSRAAPRARTDRRARLLAAAAVAVVTAVAFANAAPNVFVYDDLNFLPIPRRAGESLAALIGRLFTADIWSARRLGVEAYRPVTFVTIALDGALYQRWLSGYHLTSIAAHVAVTVALYWLVLALLEGSDTRSGTARPWQVAAVTAAVFGVHAIHTESVNCVFNRGDVLVALFTLGTIGALWHFLPARPRLAWGLAALGYLLALFSKENAVVVPVAALAVLVPLRFKGPLRQRLWQSLPALTFLLPLLVYAVTRQAAMARTTWGTAPLLGIGEAVALSLTAFRDMLALVLWPYPLRAVRTDYTAQALPLAIAVIAAYAAAVALAWRRLPGVAAGLLFFAVTAVPALPLVTRLGNAQVIAERYVYVPSVGLAIAFAFLLAALMRRVGSAALWGIGGPLVLVLLLLTWERNRAWHSDIALFEAEVAAAPGNPEAVLDLEMSYFSAGRVEDSLRLCAEHAEAPTLGLERFFMHCALRLEGRGRLAEAEPYFRKGAGGDAPPPAYYAYGRYLVRMGRPAEAARQYERALAIEGDPVRQHMIRAEMLFKLRPDRPADALTEIDAALAGDPSFQMAIDLRRRIVAAMGGSAGVARAPTARDSDIGERALAPARRDALVDGLRRAPAGSPVWLAVDERDSASVALAATLADAFAAAGWTLRQRSPIGFRMKPGIYVLAADEHPPAFVQTAIDALTAAGLAPMAATGYRAYYADAVRTKPGYQGFPLADDQSYVIAVGPRGPG